MNKGRYSEKSLKSMAAKFSDFEFLANLEHHKRYNSCEHKDLVRVINARMTCCNCSQRPTRGCLGFLVQNYYRTAGYARYDGYYSYFYCKDCVLKAVAKNRYSSFKKYITNLEAYDCATDLCTSKHLTVELAHF